MEIGCNSTNNTLCNNATTDFGNMWMYALPFQLLITLIAFVGNFLVCIIGFRLRNAIKKTVTRSCHHPTITLYALLANLAVADLGTTVFGMPISILITIYPTYDLGPGICLLQYSVLRWCMAASVVSLICISLERYFVLCTSPPKSFHLPSAIAGIWISSFLVCVFPLSRWQFYDVSAYITVCIVNYSVDDYWIQIVDSVLVGLYYVVGLGMITYLYISVFKTVRKTIKESIEIKVRSKLEAHRVSRNVLVMLICCVVFFVVCWTPLIVYLGLLSAPNLRIMDFPPAFSLAVAWISYLNSAVNPIIYYVGSKQYRDAFIATIKCQSVKVEYKLEGSVAHTSVAQKAQITEYMQTKDGDHENKIHEQDDTNNSYSDINPYSNWNENDGFAVNSREVNGRHDYQNALTVPLTSTGTAITEDTVLNGILTKQAENGLRKNKKKKIFKYAKHNELPLIVVEDYTGFNEQSQESLPSSSCDTTNNVTDLCTNGNNIGEIKTCIHNTDKQTEEILSGKMHHEIYTINHESKSTPFVAQSFQISRV